jgi:hypothetical protein
MTDRQMMEVSETHTEASHAENAYLTQTVGPVIPKPEPKAVILIAPVDAAFAIQLELTAPMASDKNCVLLPVLLPVVRVTRLVHARPCPILHSAAVSESQSVASNLLAYLKQIV